MQASPIVRRVSLAAALLAIWWILSGLFDILHFGTGVVTAILVALLYSGVRDGMHLHVGRLLLFLPWLLLQIIISNLRVARLVFRRRMDIRPTFISQPPGVRGERALTLLAMSTTLTPGTLTVDVGNDEFFVHALDARSAEDIRQHVMADHVAAVFSPGTR